MEPSEQILLTAIKDSAERSQQSIALLASTMKEMGDRTERSFEILADVLRDLPKALSKTTRMNGTSRTNGNAPSLLVGLAGIVFGLMAPMYLMIQGTNTALTEHKQLGSHTTAAAHLATLTESLREVETQFKNIDERTHRIETSLERDIDEIKGWFQTPHLRENGRP